MADDTIIDGEYKVLPDQETTKKPKQTRALAQQLRNGFRATASYVGTKAANTNLYLSQAYPAPHNLTTKSVSAAAKAAYGAAHFYDLATVASCTAGAAKDLYSAIFESAALALGKPKSKFAPKAALATSVVGATAASLIAFGSSLVEEKDPNRLYADECGDIGTYTYSTEPDADRYFANDRVLNIWDGAGVPKRVALWTQDIPFNPDAIKAYEESPRIRQYIDMAVSEAEKQGISPALFVNLLHRESVGFNEDVVSGKRHSPAGAIGIAQFMPRLAQSRYNLSAEDLGDWRKSIPASAHHLASLYARYNNDPILALFEYNGGRSSVEFARKETENENLGGIGVMRFYNDRRTLKNQCGYIASAWHNESYKYAGIITGQSWSDDHYRSASLSVTYNDFAIDPAITAEEMRPEPEANIVNLSQHRPTSRPANFSEIVAVTRAAEQKRAADAAVRQALQPN